MPLSTCIFAARFDRPPDDLPARLERIRAFYQPVGLGHVSVVKLADNLLVGLIGGDVSSLPAAGELRWGERLPDGLDVIRATASELQAIDGMCAAFAWDGTRVVVVNAPSGPATLYSVGPAVATHAVAAALLAGVVLELDHAAVAEFVAMDFPGGERTLLSGVSALPPAIRITLTAGEATRETYWPAAERWQLLPERDAYESAERELIEGLSRRTRGTQLGLALTAGLDSTVAAAALAEVGASPRAFTWGEPGWPDSTGAAATAQRFGFDHSVTGWEPLSDDECLTGIDRDARWADGVAALATARRLWQEDLEAVVVGMGGEAGRAFYYDAWSALFTPHPAADRLALAVGGGEGRLRGAHGQALSALSNSLREWIESARATGVADWRVLDVLYAEQRVRRWGRSQLPCVGFGVVPVFTPPRLARALVSLPLEDRLTDGFHRRFLAARGITPASAAAQIPSYGALGWFVRRRLYALRGRRTLPYDDPVDLLVASVWEDKPHASEWLREDVLRHKAVMYALGTAWADATWESFKAGRIRSTERLMRAAGVAAFANAIARA